jgi:hypothetical protein
VGIVASVNHVKQKHFFSVGLAWGLDKTANIRVYFSLMKAQQKAG